jgi:uncharacterized protein (TIGR03663 family)
MGTWPLPPAAADPPPGPPGRGADPLAAPGPPTAPPLSPGSGNTGLPQPPVGPWQGDRAAIANPRLAAAVPWLLLALALAARLPWLDLRPAHSDEGVNGWFVERLLASGYYPYDPENYHGPLHFYLVALSRLLFGRNLWALRLPTVLLGAVAVWLAARCDGALGRRTAWGAALFLAVSPALVLYARWGIHETEFLFFSILAFHGFCRWSQHPSRAAAWQIGIGAAGLLATKEVWIAHAIALGAAWVLWRQSRRWLTERPPVLPSWRQVAIVGAVCLGFVALLYAGFGRDPGGLGRFFAPYTIWTDRAIAGVGHEKPWHYWLGLFARYEPPALLGLLAAPLAALLAPPPLRLLAIYGGGVVAGYSLVAYKTPWCVLQLVWPLAFTAAWGLAWLADRLRRPAAGTVAVVTMAVVSAALAWRLNALRYDDNREPYVYVQTHRDGLAPVDFLRRAAAADPTLLDEPVHVVMRLSWPIPWLLAEFRRAGHWSAERLPPGDAVALFVDAPHRAAVEERLQRPYLVVPFDVSPVHSPARAYFDAERFAGALPAGTETLEPAAPPPAEVAAPAPQTGGSTPSSPAAVAAPSPPAAVGDPGAAGIR